MTRSPARQPRSDRHGFTLVELAVVVMIVGILAGLVMPNLHQALMKAQAAHIASDAHTISLAAYDYLSDNGTFPTSRAALTSRLPADFSWSYKGATYIWFGLTLPNSNNSWHSRNVGLLLISYPSRPDLQSAMQALQGPDSYWSPSLFYYIYAG